MEKSFNDHSVIANEPSQVSELVHIRIFCHIKSHHCQDVALDLILAPSKRNTKYIKYTVHIIQYILYIYIIYNITCFICNVSIHMNLDALYRFPNSGGYKPAFAVKPGC